MTAPKCAVLFFDSNWICWFHTFSCLCCYTFNCHSWLCFELFYNSSLCRIDGELLGTQCCPADIWFLPLPGLTPREQCSNCVHVVFWKQSASLQLVSHLGTVKFFTLPYCTLFRQTLSDCIFVFVWLLLLVRWTYQEFFSRYRVLMKQKDVLTDRKMTCKNVLEKLVQVQQAN